MGIFKTKQNKKYNYTPRFYKGERSPFEIKHKFDDQRVTIKKTNLKGKITNAIDDLKTNPNTLANRRVSVIILILIFVFLWIIDFDLSIFF
ncbi:MAG: riboflavin synthase subunit beta [Flavobacteriaceae bacterium]|jgi:hypothetical protein|nr:riboflavin synthase subunit beta [Flavobacteriaceae bacterium]